MELVSVYKFPCTSAKEFENIAKTRIILVLKKIAAFGIQLTLFSCIINLYHALFEDNLNYDIFKIQKQEKYNHHVLFI
jgi:hypothetical protein